MINPRLSLALTMESSPGTFAILLGSGASREAEIPTGWDVTLDLIEKLAGLEDEDTQGSPADWYRERYKAEPDYSDLLDQIAGSPAERQQLLRSYFEATEEEREQGLKVPTEAHKAIASLVARGFVKTIITTNFDRLMEQALEGIGVAPTVISTADQVRGAVPLVHTDCTVIKVHGDYLDTRIRNTPDELAEYPEEINSLLDQLLDEFGFVICGWSATWDPALRAAFERCPARRYSTYWTAYDGLSEEAERLVEQRDADVIEIEGAEEFFTDLRDKVLSLHERAQPHPASVEAAVGSVKRYLPEEQHEIRLHDLIVEEADRVYQRLSNWEDVSGQFNDDELLKRVRRYEDYAEILQHMFAVGCFWAQGNLRDCWIQALERIANPSWSTNPYKQVWVDLLKYPALLTLYTGGLSALAREDYRTVLRLLSEPQVTDPNRPRERTSLVLEVNASDDVLRKNDANKLFEDNQKVPLNERLFQAVREPTARIVPDDVEYERLFDRCEYLLALVYVDTKYEDLEEERVWAPVGRFGYRWRHNTQEREEFWNEIAGEDSPLLQGDHFDGSPDRLHNVKEAFDSFCWRGTW